LPEGEERWGSAAKENGLRPESRGREVEFADQGVDVAIDQRAIAGLGVKGAITALLGAEGDMDIEAWDRGYRGIDHEDKITEPGRGATGIIQGLSSPRPGAFQGANQNQPAATGN
jgi:hypothetical protein